jgi:hypothetical protein
MGEIPLEKEERPDSLQEPPASLQSGALVGSRVVLQDLGAERTFLA